MTRRRGRGRRRQLWTLALIVIDVLLGSALYASSGGGPVVLAVVIACILGVFASSRRRTRSRRS
jgi:hypothetical protein